MSSPIGRPVRRDSRPSSSRWRGSINSCRRSFGTCVERTHAARNSDSLPRRPLQEVDPDGYFEIDYTPDDDTEYYVEGTIEDGEAELYVEVGGFFGLDGIPLAAGPLECDSWGEDYFASKDG